MASVAGAQHLPQIADARACPAIKHTAFCSKFVKSGRVRCIKLPLSPRMLIHMQKRYARWEQASKCSPRACNAVSEGINHGDGIVQSKGASWFLRGLQNDSYPWSKFTTNLMHHAAHAVWILGKWVVVPAVILLALRDTVLAVATENELWIPVGLLMGTLFTGILNETFSTLGFDFQHNVLPWHLLELGLFFVIMRVGASKIAPFWFRMFLYHFVIGGLWQTIRFCLNWKAKNEHSVHEEVNSESV